MSSLLIVAKLLLARLMDQSCFARWWLLSAGSVMLPAGGPAGHRVRRQSGGRHSTAGQYGYVPSGWHLVFKIQIQTNADDNPILRLLLTWIITRLLAPNTATVTTYKTYVLIVTVVHQHTGTLTLLVTHLRLRISKPTVELEEFWSIMGQHQSCVQHPYNTSTDSWNNFCCH